MKTMMQITLLILTLTSFVVFPYQKIEGIEKLEGIYQGRIEDGYSFCYKTESGLERTIVFNEILSIILEKYPLYINKHVGQNFIISFTKDIIMEEKGSREVSTIIRLQKLVSGHHLRK